VEIGAIIRLVSEGRASWFTVRTSTSGSGGTWMLPEGTRLRYVGIRNSPPIGSDPLPVPHFEIMTGEQAGSIVDRVGAWEFVVERET
jgi:hypothetical protein